MNMLKFTPRTYKISIYGYGGEYVMGRVDRKVFDYFRNNRINFSEWAWGDSDVEVPDELVPFDQGCWYDCDGLVHESGADMDSSTVEISDENNETVAKFDSNMIDEEGGWRDGSGEEEYIHNNVTEDHAVFFGVSNEKGTFFEGEIELTQPFDIKKLCIITSDIDGAEIISGVMYDDEDIECLDMSTTGKSSDMALYSKDADDKLIRYTDMDSIDWPMTDWFPNKVKPTVVGEYEIKQPKVEWTRRAEWNGEKWMSTYGDEEIKVKEWRGLSVDPDTHVF
jgi:hypothetical protein